jgi:hypothetical protein
MFIMFGIDIALTALSDIHALDTVNWRWVTEYSASGYPLLSTVTNTTTNTTTNTASADSNNNSNGSSQSSGLSTGAIAGIAVGAVVVVVRVYYDWNTRSVPALDIKLYSFSVDRCWCILIILPPP